MKNPIVTCCLAVFILFVIPWSTYSQNSKQGPRLALPEKEFDFGEVNEGSTIRHDFIVLNKGDSPLIIREVKPG